MMHLSSMVTGISYMIKKKLKQKQEEAQRVAVTSVVQQGQSDSKTSSKVKGSDGSKMETDQAELDSLLNQSVGLLNKN